MAFDKAGGAQRPVQEQAPPPVPRPKQAPTKAVPPSKYSHLKDRLGHD
jgi:hypothetical protein